MHGNVKDTEEAQWIDYLVSTIIKLSTVLGNGSLNPLLTKDAKSGFCDFGAA